MNLKPLALAALMAVSMGAWAQTVQSIDRVLAVVDKQVITLAQLESTAKQLRASLPKNTTLTDQQIQSQALSQLVDHSLMVQLAQRTGIKVSDAEVKQNMGLVARKNGWSDAQWVQAVQEELLIEKLKQRDLYSRVQVSEAEILQVIGSLPESEKKAGASGQTVTAYLPQHILIAINAQTSEAEALAKITQLRSRLSQGESFEELARANSQDPGSAANGGLLGWALDGMLVPEFEKTMKSLPIGALSQPVRTNFGYHLIKVVQKRDQDAGDAQLRAKVRKQITEEKAQGLYGNWIGQMRQQAYVSIKN